MKMVEFIVRLTLIQKLVVYRLENQTCRISPLYKKIFLRLEKLLVLLRVTNL